MGPGNAGAGRASCPLLSTPCSGKGGARSLLGAACWPGSIPAKSANAPWLKYSLYHGVGKCDLPSCVATGKVWKAEFKGKWLGAYVIEKDAALAHDAAIRALRNSNPVIWRKGTLMHGSRTRYQPWVMRLNFPTNAEKKRQQKYEQACAAEQEAAKQRAEERNTGNCWR